MSKLEALVNETDALLSAMEDNTISVMSTAFNKAFDKLEKQFKELYPVYLNDESTLATVRAKILLEQLAEYLTLINPDNEEAIKERLETLIEDAQQAGIDLATQTFAEASGGYTPLGTTINTEAVAFAAQNANDRLKAHSETFRQRAVAIIAFNMTLGSGTSKVASQLRKELGITKGKAEAIARTETISALNEATDYFHEKNDIDLVQQFATADDRTCPYCTSRNQSIYKRADIKLPLHVRCRCYAVPFKQAWADEGKFDLAFSQRYYKLVKEDSDHRDGGVAPFEKANGLTTAPKPYWHPTRGYAK